MALPTSALSTVCLAVREFLRAALNGTGDAVTVLVGNPADAAKDADDEHRVNLFFYRVAPAGYYEHGTSGDPRWLRLQCLITAFGLKGLNISSGENDLRLLGAVLRTFHEHPVLDAMDVDGERIRLQIVFQPLTLDEINHLWSTQGDVAYRPSVLYEMALTPIVPRQRTIPAPRVGEIGLEARAATTARTARFMGATAAPPVPRGTVDVQLEDWAPRVCFVVDGLCHQALSFEIGSPELAALVPLVWIAGETGSVVTLAWEEWTSATGWSAGPTSAASASGEVLDPDQPPDAGVLSSVALPFKDHPGQMLLSAQRTYRRALDDTPRTVRSNPLLVSLYEAPA